MSRNALFQLGMDLEDPSTAQADTAVENDRIHAVTKPVGPGHEAITPHGVMETKDDERLDFFIVRDGVECAGTHLIIDLKGADGLDDLARVDRALRACVEAAEATLLHIHLHHFTPNGGISGVAVLAESHISIHTWPERKYAALDVFMCGDAKPEACVPVLKAAFQPEAVEVERLLRGRGA